METENAVLRGPDFVTIDPILIRKQKVASEIETIKSFIILGTRTFYSFHFCCPPM
jgi:hypothetical protein